MTLTHKFVAIFAIATAALVSHAFAATNFSVPGPADWTDPGNWDNGVPTAATETRVGTTVGGGVSTATATLSKNQVGMTLNLTIGRDSGDVGEVDLSNHANLQVNSVLQIGYLAGSTGSLILKNNSTLDVYGAGSNINVGNDGTGTLEVHGNAIVGDVSKPQDLRVGRNSGSTGTVLIDGGTVNTNNYVSVGGLNTQAGGQGTLRIKSGGTLNVGSDMYVWGPNNGPGTRSFLRIDSTANLNVTGNLNFNGGGLQLDDGADLNTANPVNLNNPPGPDNNGVHVLVKDSNTGTIDAELDGTGHLVKEGNGTLILTNLNNLYTGGSNINNGTVVVGAGIFIGPSVFGKGDVNLNGDINTIFRTPEGMPLEHSIDGSFFANSGQFYVQVGGTAFAQHDVMAVEFDAVLDSNNSHLFVHRINGYNPNNGDVATIIGTFLGGRFGEFSDAPQFGTGGPAPNDFLGLIQPFADYGSQYVDLVFGFAHSFASVAKTPNQIATATALDNAVAAGCIVAATNYLGNVPINSLRHAYDVIAPEELASMYEASFAQGLVQSLNLQRRMDDIRWGSTGFCADGFVIQDNHGYTKNDGKSVSDKNMVEQTAPPNYRWGSFITGSGELTKTGEEGDNANGYQLNQAGFTMGVDYRVTDHWAIGLSGGYTHTRGDLVDNGRLNTDGGRMGLYTTYYTHGFYVDAAASGGWNQYDTRRSAYLGQENGSTDGGEFNGMVALGYDWKRGCWTFGPTASFEYNYVEFNSFTESDTSLIPLHFPDQNQEAYRSNLGFRVAHEQVMKPGEGLTVVPELRASWRHDFGPQAYAIDSNFAGCTDIFTVHGPWVGRDSAVVDLGLTAYCTPGLSAYIFYDGQFGRDNYNNNAVSGGFRVAF